MLRHVRPAGVEAVVVGPSSKRDETREEALFGGQTTYEGVTWACIGLHKAWLDAHCAGGSQVANCDYQGDETYLADTGVCAQREGELVTLPTSSGRRACWPPTILYRLHAGLGIRNYHVCIIDGTTSSCRRNVVPASHLPFGLVGV